MCSSRIFVVLGLVKKHSILTTILAFILASLFSSCEDRKVTYWDAIDQNSALIFETIHRPIVTEKILQPFFRVSSTAFVISLQSIAKNEYELLYSYPLIEKKYTLLLKDTSLSQSKQKIVSRLYNGSEIKEIRNDKNAVIVAFTYFDGVFLLSKSSFLIENAIRTIADKKGINFKIQNKKLFQFASIKSDAGNLYVNFNQLSRSALTNSTLTNSIPLLKRFAKSAVLDVKVDDSFISMNGFTIDSITKKASLAVFQDQRAVKFEMARFIPNSSKASIHYGFSDFQKLAKALGAKNDLESDLADELAVCTIDQEKKKFLLFIKLKDHNLVSLDSGDYFESYAGYEIRSSKSSKLCQTFKDLIPKGNYEYYSVKENFGFFAEDVADLKSLIDAIENDDTWGRSLSFQRFYERGLQESNISLFFKEPSLINEINEKWRSLIDSMHLSTLVWASVQLTSLDNHFYTSVNIEAAAPAKGKTNKKSRPDRASFRLPNTIALGYTVKSHVSSDEELILQDSTFKIHLFSGTNGILWQYPLDGMIQDVQELDYFKNNKFQYFITTPTSIYIIDRLGHDVQGFPKQYPFTITHSEVVDYDKSKNYRFLLSAGENMYILDKSGAELEGWNPKKLTSKINDAQHYRIGGKDYFEIFTEDGSVHFFNRRGDHEAGSPIKLKLFSGDYFIETGTKLSNTFLYTILSEGIVTKRSLDGKIISQENLVKGNNSKFSLITTKTGKSDFFSIRIDDDKIAVFNKLNQLVFEKQNPGSSKLIPLAVNLSTDRTIFCFYDNEQKFSYLYDQVGNSVLNRPLESSIAPLFGMDTKNKKVFIYSFFEDAVTVTPVN
jgi:hypothetical protein